jgi:hypothetical protein
VPVLGLLVVIAVVTGMVMMGRHFRTSRAGS